MDLADAPDRLLDAWQQLHERAIEGNAFLSPWFVRAAARWLDPGLRIQLLLVEACPGEGDPWLTGLLPFHRAPACRSLPFPHLVAYRAVHAYSSGALLHAAHAEATLRSLFDALPAIAPDCGALRLANVRCDGALGQASLPLLRRASLRWFATRQAARAALRLRSDAAAGERGVPASSPSAGEPDTAGTTKSLQRGLERLEAMAGPVTLRLLRGDAITAATIERHLALENAGWKGRTGAALLSDPAQAGFFREISREAAAAGEALFAELVAGDAVVASTSNFLAGREGFAFKLGWDPAYARCSPGLLVDDALRREAHAALPTLRLIDGCADPGSHLERIWPGRVNVADGYLAWSRRERLVLATFERLRRLRHPNTSRPPQR